MKQDYILFISNGFPHTGSLAGIFAFDQAKAMKAQGYRVLFLSYDLNFNNLELNKGISSFEKEGIKVYCINKCFRKIPHALRQFLTYKYAKKLLSVVIKENGIPKLIHAHFALSGYVAARYNKKIKTRLVMTEHASAFNKDKISFMLKRLGGFAHRSADKVIAVSGALKEKIKKHSKVDSIVIPNIISSETFSPGFDPNILNMDTKTPKSNTFTFISVGYLIVGKGHDIAIEAFSKAFKNDENVRLKIIGTGESEQSLKELVNTHGLNDRIEFLGALDRNSINKEFNKSNAFVLASRGETFGVVYVEALMSGLPVIATDCGGPTDFIDESNGIIVPLNSVDSVARAMLEIKDNISNYDSAMISKSAKERFSPEVVGVQIKAVYEQL